MVFIRLLIVLFLIVVFLFYIFKKDVLDKIKIIVGFYNTARSYYSEIYSVSNSHQTNSLIDEYNLNIHVTKSLSFKT